MEATIHNKVLVIDGVRYMVHPALAAAIEQERKEHALDHADAIAWREHLRTARRGAPLTPEILAKVHKENIGTLGPYTIWAVDGEAVRVFDVDFTTGANPSLMAYFPAGELWYEPHRPSDDAPKIVHEAVEDHVMSRFGIDYDRAHDFANSFEIPMRAAIAAGTLVVSDLLGAAKDWLDRHYPAAIGL